MQIGPYWVSSPGQNGTKLQMFLSAPGAFLHTLGVPHCPLLCLDESCLGAVLRLWQSLHASVTAVAAWACLPGAPWCKSFACLALQPCSEKLPYLGFQTGSKPYNVPYTVTLTGAGSYTSVQPWNWAANVSSSGQVRLWLVYDISDVLRAGASSCAWAPVMTPDTGDAVQHLMSGNITLCF